MARMSDDPQMPFGFGGLDPESLRDAPLFRELQRVMAGSHGPVNWELARQVGVATAVESGDDDAPTADEQRTFEEAVRVAELHVGRLTGLTPPGRIATTTLLRRSGWVTATIESLHPLLRSAAARMSEALERATREQLPPEASGATALIGQLGPLLQGTQIGQVFGGLSHHLGARYDLWLPAPEPTHLVFVPSNIAAFERDWSIDPTEYRTFVALHEVAVASGFAAPWVEVRFAELVDDYLVGYAIDVERIRTALEGFDPSNPESLQGLGVEDGAVFGPVLDAEQRIKLARVQAFLAAAEGYADHVRDAIVAELLPGSSKIHEARRRHREEHPIGPSLERLLGVELPAELPARGRRFCDEVAASADETTLARMWESAEAMPSLPELEEPILWLARTG